MENLKEVLLVGSKSSNPFSTSVINPLNGHAIWSHKGNEYRGGESNIVETVGRHGDYIAVASSAQPFLHFITPKKHTVTTTLPGKPDAIQITQTGRFALVLINSKVYSYNVQTGEMLKIVTNSFLKTCKMFLCSNDKYVAFPMNDGNLFVYKLGSFLVRAGDSEEELPPNHSFQAHSKEITDVSFSHFDSLLMLSAGLDHRLVLYNLQKGEELLKIHFDAELTTCSLNLSDTMLFCGTKTGRLVKLSLFQAQGLDKSTHIIQTQQASETKTHTVYDKHEGNEICKICLNLDGSRMATGDLEGKVLIWDISSGQIVARNRKNGEIHTLRFSNSWSFLPDLNVEPDAASVQKFQHELSKMPDIFNVSNELNEKQRATFKEFNKSVGSPQKTKEKTHEPEVIQLTPAKKPAKSGSQAAEHLRLNDEIGKIKAEISELQKANDNLLNFMSAENDSQIEE